MSAVAKPILRGRGLKEWTYVLYASLGTAAAFATWYKINVVERRKQTYIDFYNNYDDAKEYEAMKAANIFKGFERP